jgi:hypothetical protein
LSENKQAEVAALKLRLIQHAASDQPQLPLTQWCLAVKKNSQCKEKGKS